MAQPIPPVLCDVTLLKQRTPRVNPPPPKKIADFWLCSSNKTSFQRKTMICKKIHLCKMPICFPQTRGVIFLRVTESFDKIAWKLTELFHFSSSKTKNLKKSRFFDKKIKKNTKKRFPPKVIMRSMLNFHNCWQTWSYVIFKIFFSALFIFLKLSWIFWKS